MLRCDLYDVYQDCGLLYERDFGRDLGDSDSDDCSSWVKQADVVM